MMENNAQEVVDMYVGTQICRGTAKPLVVIETEEDPPIVVVVLALPPVLVLVPPMAIVPVLVVVMLILAMVLVLAIVFSLVRVRKQEAGVRYVAATDFFFFLGGTPPLRHLPVGIPVIIKLVMFGRFFAFTNHSTSPFSSPSISATATLCRGVASIGLSGLEPPPPLSSHRTGSGAGCWPS